MKQPNRVYTMAELSEMIRCPRRRLVRRLLRMHRERDNQLLVNTGSDRHPRWTVTLEALHSAAPAWFSDSETVEARLDELEAQSEARDSVIQAQSTQIASLRGEVKKLRVHVDVVTSSLKAIVAP